MKEHTLTKGSVGKGILLFVLPIIVGSLIQQLYVTIDAVVVGQFTGKLGLAAIDSVHTLFKFPLNFMNGLASGATIIISGHCGSKDEKQMHCSIRTACTVAVILGVICSVGGVLLTPWMLNVMSVPEFMAELLRIPAFILAVSGPWYFIIWQPESCVHTEIPNVRCMC